MVKAAVYRKQFCVNLDILFIRQRSLFGFYDLHGLFNTLPDPYTRSSDQCGTVGTPFRAAADGNHLTVEHIGMNLAPQIAECAATRCPDLMDLDAHLLY